MPVTASVIGKDEIYGTIEGKLGVFAKSPTGADFMKYANLRYRHLFGDGTSYVAFPAAELLQNGKLLIWFSFGPGHADSDRVMLALYDRVNDTVQTSVLYYDGTFPAADLTMLQGQFAPNEVVLLRIGTFSADGAGVVSVSFLSTQVEGGITYAFFSGMKKRPIGGGLYYRMAYGSNRAALFSSPNGKAPWTLVSIPFPLTGGKIYTEADMDWLADGRMLMVCREATAGSTVGAVEYSIANGNGSSPSAPILYARDVINGVQPQLRRLSTGAVRLFLADRDGATGLGAGVPTNIGNRRGVGTWLLPSGAEPIEANWSVRMMIANMYSSDGAQPWPVVTAGDDIFCPYYARQSVGLDPNLYMVCFDGTKT